MAAPQKQTQQTVYTEDEYYQFTETAEERWEYVPNGLTLRNGKGLGVIRAMSGGTFGHGLIAMNIGGTLRAKLSGRGCRVVGSDVRIRCGDGVNTYPDVSVVCGPVSFHKEPHTMTNPLLVVEVLSASTRKYDMGKKFGHYKTVPGLVDYLLVFQDQAQVILYSRNGDTWSDPQIVSGRDGSVRLASLDIMLSLADVYEQVELRAEKEQA